MNTYLWLTSIGLLFITTLFYKKEHFQNNCIFMSKEKTQQFLKEDSDGYLQSMSQVDLRARRVFSISEYIVRSIQDAMDFIPYYKHKLNQAVGLADQFFSAYRNFYIDPSIQTIPWKFMLTSGYYEQGLPHTREDSIFITPSTLQEPLSSLVITLIHEKIHIYQRLYKKEFQQKLLQMNYKIIGLRSTVPLLRANPDLDEYVYKDQRDTPMVCYYTSDHPYSIQDVKGSKYEHPNEEIAYTLSHHYKDI